MCPARERFEACHMARLEVDQRLVEELELVLVERSAKLRLDREAPTRLGRLLGLIDLWLAHGLGLLDRELCVAEQFLSVLAGVHQRYADRALDLDLELR